jgi:hypothetical protein
LYASCEWWHLALTFSSAFLLLKYLQRNRLAGRLTQLKPAQAIDYKRKNTERDAIAAACAAAVSAAYVVNSRSRNIFNGLLLVPVNEIIPALNSI